MTAIAMELKDVEKSFGSVIALSHVSVKVREGAVTCILGDNGAGKSTLIKVLSGVHKPTSGVYEVQGEPVSFESPRDALANGIATVYQDLATIPLMSVWRNFFLGNEITKGWGPFRRLDVKKMKELAKQNLLEMGIDLRDTGQQIGTLSGGERQAVAIARAVYFGAKVLILDEPTSALGVRQSGIVLKYVLAAKERGVSVVFITHNPHHAYLVGDFFYLLNRGHLANEFERAKVELDELTKAMAGGAELDALTKEIQQVRADS
ncbi:MAG: ATP-binding cassette domain-containing protein [Actinomycetota bacterium]|nr:ATP-binding cassette domain-containing protein [Actinomycetota bacterium]MDA2980672.1 ATP-binding cassette domain-containing protein [Actinomycetota bacterium]MDA3003117.1 ATP-binding cassette domain-containing protein [Actinomycetota bacterium]